MLNLLHMDIFEEGYRTIGTRGIILTEEQMDNFRIKKIYNSFGDPNFMNDDFAREMWINFNTSGEYCLLEALNTGKLYSISVLTFEDIWSRNVFAMFHFEFYNGSPDLITLYN